MLHRGHTGKFSQIDNARYTSDSDYIMRVIINSHSREAIPVICGAWKAHQRAAFVSCLDFCVSFKKVVVVGVETGQAEQRTLMLLERSPCDYTATFCLYSVFFVGIITLDVTIKY